MSTTNSFAVNFPELAKQWHPVKNEKQKPWHFTQGSMHIAWWKCENGTSHEWEAPISSRRYHGCPFCSPPDVSEDISLAAKFPELAKEWNFEKNGTLRPTDVTYGSKQRVWWICNKVPSHTWQTAVTLRTSNKAGCAICAGKVVVLENSLSTKNPTRAGQWHRTKNETLSPSDVSCGSNKIVWWQCDKNKKHEWQQSIKTRVVSPLNCPICEGYGPERVHRMQTPRT